jgi:hypothetical protein
MEPPEQYAAKVSFFFVKFTQEFIFEFQVVQTMPIMVPPDEEMIQQYVAKVSFFWVKFTPQEIRA